MARRLWLATDGHNARHRTHTHTHTKHIVKLLRFSTYELRDGLAAALAKACDMKRILGVELRNFLPGSSIHRPNRSQTRQSERNSSTRKNTRNQKVPGVLEDQQGIVVEEATLIANVVPFLVTATQTKKLSKRVPSSSCFGIASKFPSIPLTCPVP